MTTTNNASKTGLVPSAARLPALSPFGRAETAFKAHGLPTHLHKQVPSKLPTTYPTVCEACGCIGTVIGEQIGEKKSWKK